MEPLRLRPDSAPGSTTIITRGQLSDGEQGADAFEASPQRIPHRAVKHRGREDEKYGIGIFYRDSNL
jgi:hypothetical protein